MPYHKTFKQFHLILANICFNDFSLHRYCPQKTSTTSPTHERTRRSSDEVKANEHGHLQYIKVVLFNKNSICISDTFCIPFESKSNGE